MAVLKESNFSGKNGTHFKLTLEYTYTQNTANNYTTITYTLKFTSMDGYSASGTADGVKGYINGSQVGTATSIGVNTTLTMGTQDVVVYHNQDGTFPSTSYGASIQTVWTLGNASVSGTLTEIPQIDRYPMLTSASNFTDEQNPTITYTTSSGFSGASVQACITDPTGYVSYADYRDVVVANGSYTFELTSTERNNMRNATPNSNTLAVRFYLRTSTSSQTFLSYLDRTITIVNANPTFDVAYQDTNNTTTTITSNNQQIIQNNSTLQLNITNAIALKGASLVSVDSNINGSITTTSISSSTLNVNIGTINVANDFNAIITLKDSRNNTTSITLPITVLSWSLPTAIITLNRKSNYYTETDIKVDANYSSLDSKNTISIKYRKKKTSEQNYGAYSNLSDNVTTTFNADNTFEWDIQVLIEDKIGSATYNLKLGIGTPIMFIDRSKRSVGIECFPQNSNTLEINGKTILDLTYPIGSIYISVSPTNPSSFFGGTWEAFGTGRTLVGVDTTQTEFNSVEKTGGSKFLQEHIHSQSLPDGGSRVGVASFNWSISNTGRWYNGTDLAGSVYGVQTGSSGNLQPYITCYMWKRTG